MLVSIEKNKSQILVSSILGFIVYLITKNDLISIIFTLSLAYVLRMYHFDNFVKNFLSNKKRIKDKMHQ
jgi:hypothetical protein